MQEEEKENRMPNTAKKTKKLHARRALKQPKRRETKLRTGQDAVQEAAYLFWAVDKDNIPYLLMSFRKNVANCLFRLPRGYEQKLLRREDFSIPNTLWWMGILLTGPLNLDDVPKRMREASDAGKYFISLPELVKSAIRSLRRERHDDRRYDNAEFLSALMMFVACQPQTLDTIIAAFKDRPVTR
jgi:hypothetical protein